WQRTFRVGYFDMVMARYAKDVLGKLDYLALTNIDRLEMMPEWKICHSYAYQGEQTDLQPFFEQKDESITKIKVQRPADLAHQEELTQRLLSCVPEYALVPPQTERRYMREDRE